MTFQIRSSVDQKIRENTLGLIQSAVYNVGKESKYATINEAIDAAVIDGHILTSSGDAFTATVFVSPGTYEENLTLGTVSAAIVGLSRFTVEIIGNHTFDSFAVLCRDVNFSASSGTCLEVSCPTVVLRDI